MSGRTLSEVLVRKQMDLSHFFHSGTNYGKHNFLSSCCHPVDCFRLFSDFLY